MFEPAPAVSARYRVWSPAGGGSGRATSRLAAEAEDEVQRRLLLDVVVGERAAVLEPARRTSRSSAAGPAGSPPCPGSWPLRFQSYRCFRSRAWSFPSRSSRILLHAAAEAKDEMERGFLLGVVVGKRATIFELLAGDPQRSKCGLTRSIWRNPSGLARGQ